MSPTSPPQPPQRSVPARYIGAYPVRLADGGGPYYDVNGNRLESLILNPGDTLKIYPHEAYGQTLLWTKTGNPPVWHLGEGQVILEDHVAHDDGTPYSDAELAAEGYEFQSGRSDFEPLVPLAEAARSSLVALHSPPPVDEAKATAEAEAAEEKRKARRVIPRSGKTTPAPVADAPEDHASGEVAISMTEEQARALELMPDQQNAIMAKIAEEEEAKRQEVEAQQQQFDQEQQDAQNRDAAGAE